MSECIGALRRQGAGTELMLRRRSPCRQLQQLRPLHPCSWTKPLLIFQGCGDAPWAATAPCQPSHALFRPPHPCSPAFPGAQAGQANPPWNESEGGRHNCPPPAIHPLPRVGLLPVFRVPRVNKEPEHLYLGKRSQWDLLVPSSGPVHLPTSRVGSCLRGLKSS